MPFEPENDLEHALVRASNDAAHAADFYKCLVDSVVLFIQRPVASGNDESVGIATMDIDGAMHLPIFSSLTRLQETISQEVSYAGVNALEFLRMTAGSPLVLNPASDYGKQITAEEAAAIVDGSIFESHGRHTAPQGSAYIIGEPKNYPTELVEVLKRMFAGRPEISRAWVAQIMLVDTDDAPHTVVGIESAGDMQQLASDAHSVLLHAEIADPPVDFVSVSDSDGVDGYFLDKEPFYAR